MSFFDILRSKLSGTYVTRRCIVGLFLVGLALSRTFGGIKMKLPEHERADLTDLPKLPGSEAEAAQLARVALPVLGHLDAQIEVDRGPEKGFDATPRCGADFLET